ncbi:hypothetical protein [Bryobacter aggregatus]|uniref:hypothetical protein n=1 Tax=Bryobacter aggregatus TaxID=360054 RepID=UPI0004E207E7|nr:hypothetical protein [Bryobacter aggregatus]
MNVQYSPDGIFLPEIDLWLDPQVSKPAAWLSHAHSDHARYYASTAIGTPVTLEIYRMRWPADAEIPQSLEPLSYGESRDWNGARLTCYPAAHILGAAQLLVEYQDERLVYTGDIKFRKPLCGVETAAVACDHLIVESTFGLPIYHFLDRQEASHAIVSFARECLEDGATPVFLGYPLGRGQEVAHALTTAGIPTAVHGAIANYIPIYEEQGYQFPGWERYSAGVLSGKALVVTPGMRRTLEASGKNVRVAYVSGWARVDSSRTSSGAERLIPYSDHGGFEELMELVEQSGAPRVDVVHGFTDVFARLLRDKGLDARARKDIIEETQE